MSLTNEKRERVKKYLLEQIYFNRLNIIGITAEAWGVSATTINRYVEKMLQENIIVENEKKRCGYELKETKRKFFSYSPQILKLEEDQIFEADIMPMISQLPPNVIKLWNYAFCEIMNNAIEHSTADQIHVIIYQNALYTHIYISDNGIGIFEKIKEYVRTNENMDITLDDAMSILFVGKMTTNKECHSGEGIFFTSRSLDKFYILSSNRMFTHDSYDKNTSANLDEMIDCESKKIIYDRKGTAVVMELWNDSKRELKEVFNMFSSNEKGFYKTQMPIKNAIPSGFPVSRSQARRLCSGFDKFEEVEIDFSDVEDVGQAFVHEIFVVFKNKHPQIKLNVKNANANVEGMIQRVINTKV